MSTLAPLPPRRTALFPSTLRATALAALSLASPALLGVAPAQAAPQATPAARPAVSGSWVSCRGVLDGVTVPIARTTSAVVSVNQTSRSVARATLWRRIAGKPCHFRKVFVESDARIGYGGTVAGTSRRQGTGTTPRGVYSMTTSFGNGPAPATSLPYRRVGAGDYWVEDNASPWYNTYRTAEQGGFRTGSDYSEHLASYPAQYRYSVVVNYNMPPNAVRFRGAGIFLHVKGKGATAGCVSLTAAHLRTVMATIHPGDLIGISA